MRYVATTSQIGQSCLGTVETSQLCLKQVHLIDEPVAMPWWLLSIVRNAQTYVRPNWDVATTSHAMSVTTKLRNLTTFEIATESFFTVLFRQSKTFESSFNTNDKIKSSKKRKIFVRVFFTLLSGSSHFITIFRHLSHNSEWICAVF